MAGGLTRLLKRDWDDLPHFETGPRHAWALLHEEFNTYSLVL